MSHNNNNSTVKHLFSVGQSWGFGNRVCLFLCSQSFFPGLSSTGRQAYFILFIYFCVYLFYLFIYIYLIYLCIYLYILFFFFFMPLKVVLFLPVFPVLHCLVGSCFLRLRLGLCCFFKFSITKC